MPRGDGTGPTGLGPMTGRAAGYCAGYSVPGYMNQRPGFGGMGFGRGGGRGFRRGGFGGVRFQPMAPVAVTPYPYGAAAYRQPTVQEERSFLENQINSLQGQLDAVKQRLDEITTQTETKKGE